MGLRNSENFNFIGNLAASISAVLLSIVLVLAVSIIEKIATIEQQNKDFDKRVCTVESEIKTIKPVLSNIQFLHKKELKGE